MLNTLITIDVKHNPVTKQWVVDLTNAEGQTWRLTAEVSKGAAIKIGERFSDFAGVQMTFQGEEWLCEND